MFRYKISDGEKPITYLDADGEFVLFKDAQEIENRCEKAMKLALKYGGIDGAHHKSWVIDQVIRILSADRYDQIVKDSCDGEDGPNTYSWDCGVAP